VGDRPRRQTIGSAALKAGPAALILVMGMEGPPMPLILSWVTTAVALLVGDQFLDGVFVGGFLPALAAAAVLGLVNVTVKPILWLLTLPINLLTLGLFTFVINALMIGLVAWLVPAFNVRSLMSALGLAIIVAIVHAVALSLFANDRGHLRR
jgi:putative membrane protein